MKLLFDENLSRKLVPRLADLFPDSRHVADIELITSRDEVIWEYARRESFVIVTTDSDFHDLIAEFGPPPKVVWLRHWKYGTAEAESLIRGNAIRISALLDDPEAGLLILSKKR